MKKENKKWWNTPEDETFGILDLNLKLFKNKFQEHSWFRRFELEGYLAILLIIIGLLIFNFTQADILGIYFIIFPVIFYIYFSQKRKNMVYSKLIDYLLIKNIELEKKIEKINDWDKEIKLEKKEINRIGELFLDLNYKDYEFLFDGKKVFSQADEIKIFEALDRNSVYPNLLKRELDNIEENKK